MATIVLSAVGASIGAGFGGTIMGLGGARRFLLGCLVPPLFVAAGVMGLDYGYAANLLASAPLWGTALSALTFWASVRRAASD